MIKRTKTKQYAWPAGSAAKKHTRTEGLSEASNEFSADNRYARRGGLGQKNRNQRAEPTSAAAVALRRPTPRVETTMEARR